MVTVTSRATRKPPELTLAWAIFDMGDESWDTTVLIDGFVEGCIPFEVNRCGVQAQ